MKKININISSIHVIILILAMIMISISTILICNLGEKRVEVIEQFSGTGVFAVYDKIDIIDSMCIRAKISFPRTFPDEMWIEPTDGKSGYCYIKYLKTEPCFFC